MNLMYWKCYLFGHSYKWARALINSRQETVGTKVCTRCKAKLRVQGSDWRSW